jgi:hypothetical protein
VRIADPTAQTITALSKTTVRLMIDLLDMIGIGKAGQRGGSGSLAAAIARAVRDLLGVGKPGRGA